MSILVQSENPNPTEIIQNSQLPSNLEDTSILKQKMKQLELEIQSLHKLKRQDVNSQKKSKSSRKDQIIAIPQPQSQKISQQPQNQKEIKQQYNQKELEYASSSRLSQNIKNSKISDLVSQLSFKDESGSKRKRSWSRTVSPYTQRQSVRNLKQTLDKIDISDQKKKKRVAAKIFQLKGINQQVESNIYNVTIAEIMTGQHKITKQQEQDQKNNMMIRQITELKSMIKSISVQNQSQEKKTIENKQQLSVNQNTVRLPGKQNSLTLPLQQTTARMSVQQKTFKQPLEQNSFKLPLQQNTQRTALNLNYQVPLQVYTQRTFLNQTIQASPVEQNTFRSEAVGTGKIYNRSRIVKQNNQSRDQELMSNTTLENGFQNQMQSIQLRKNSNPFTWNPQINLTLAQIHKPYAIKSNRIRSGRIYSSIQMQKSSEYSEQKRQQSKRKPLFHIMKKKKLQQSIKKETQTIEVQTDPKQEIVQKPIQKPKRIPKKAEQRFTQIKIDKFNNEQQPPTNFVPNFRQYINQKLLSINLPDSPTLQDSQSDLEELGRVVFELFDVYVDEENQKKGTQYKVTKYKNCVLFRLNEEKNIVWYFDGKFYFGGWEINLVGEGKKEEFGFEIIPQSHTYQGYFKNSKRDGYGIISHFSLSDIQKNVIYDGFWSEGLKQGKGYQIEDELQYLGDFRQGIQTGFCHIKTEQTFYEGQIKESIKQGKGHQTLKNGDQYKGEFKQNMFYGTGEYKWKSGAYFYGSFIEGKRKGEGIWISNMKSESFDIYKGSYDDNKKNGFGIYRWANGTIYEGYFKNDLRHDEGLMIFPNGKAAKFMWKDGNKANKIYSEEEEVYRRNRNSKTKMNVQGDNEQPMEENVISNRSRVTFLQQVLEQLLSLNLDLYQKPSPKQQLQQAH